MWTPANINMPDPVYVVTFGTHSLGPWFKGIAASVPSSGTYPAANRIYFAPFSVSKPYSLARWWWLNGATVGTDYLQAAIYDESFNLFKASPRTLSAGTANQVQYANPGIHGTNLDANFSNSDLATYTTGASITMKAGNLYLMSVENSHGSSASAVSAITATGGGAPTFTSRSTTQYNTNLNRVSIWSCVPTVDYTGTLDIAFGGTTQTGMVYSLEAFYHVDTASQDGVVQNAVGTGNSTTPLATLAAFGSANNATYGAFGNVAGGGTTPSTGYIEFADTGGTTPTQRLATDFRPDNDTTVDCTITSGQWGACAVEIKSLGTGAIAIPPMRGYLAIHCSGTTATVFRITGSSLYQPEIYLQSSATTGFPPTATPAGSAQAVIVMGFTSRSSP